MHRRGRPTEIKFLSANLVLDLARGDADLAVRVVEPVDPALVRQRTGSPLRDSGRVGHRG